jgi:SAM-dependent methyltransferase
MMHSPDSPGRLSRSTAYDPRQYWDARLGKRWEISGVGHAGYSLRYNRWLYRAQERSLRALLRRAGADVSGKRVLDVGSGTGHWLGWYTKLGVGSLTALELSRIAAQRLRQKFEAVEVVEGDIAAQDTDLGAFDLVNVVSVMYHVVDPALFQRSLENLARMTIRGGWLILSDQLGTREVQAADHVRFRPLALYEERLSSLGFRIKMVQPVYTLLNGGLRQAVELAFSQSGSAVQPLEEALAPVLYMLDGLPGLTRWANMRLLIARKRSVRREFPG